ncbi:LEAF RUST 10 DISEASE-RESISTANCE LOCUS RECEPTOR-LIKE PROTEIN KINASE-like 1.2 isoform X1 [Brachypodium distachyon]|uniref:LEAF RUST 10 DISEASE-RESISTANCE LOCUS RECEPTOR-LIKE PROTEIN KINASE-like 1.2 isoform X1 n=1 Tax=Brachypodium distachyon TaxID=15368 RepID=UPI000D0CCAB6|nr:LEAF RUST 10 DISEASE-RESISTANCE LOCUS RECEPTOR-LIKE PROTEIN KINASE-like 1.2 isoform X1 [Brachypodium distachyon]|eukprot:XP_024315263.1 LEAF RUST 10 DISEASE-RESISTANCE LOCUS RECEPTOR-LIKE PROTEIN KINASE-like 1.2 isoform X1 [Brachypodium distachyon]
MHGERRPVQVWQQRHGVFLQLLRRPVPRGVRWNRTTTAINTTTPSFSPSSCDPATCGDLRISYPFWLSGTHPPECGYRAFQVTCDNINNTVKASLKNSLWTYQILSISYPDSSFTVTNLQFSEDGACDIELHVNASADLGIAPFGISGTNKELFFLYGCTHPQQLPPSRAPVACTDGGSGSNNSNASSSLSPSNNTFAWLAGGYKPEYDAWRSVQGGNCTVSMVPVLGYEGATGADYQRLMKGGFLLQYAAGDCDACVDSGGFCRINTTYDILECHCSGGVVSELIVCGTDRPLINRKGKMRCVLV